jgi:hypothetical protein
MMNASIFRMPLLIKKTAQNVSKTVIKLRQSMKYQSKLSPLPYLIPLQDHRQQ